MTEPVKINSVPFLRRLWSSWRGKKRNKKTLEELARYNLELWPPAQIRAALGVGDDDRSALCGLADRPEGWHDYLISPGAPGDYDRLAALGLIRFKWRTSKIYLTDAGRFFLSLTAVVDPPGNDD